MALVQRLLAPEQPPTPLLVKLEQDLRRASESKHSQADDKELSMVQHMAILAEVLVHTPEIVSRGAPLWFPLPGGVESNCIWAPVWEYGARLLADRLNYTLTAERGERRPTLALRKSQWPRVKDVLAVATFIEERVMTAWTDMPADRMVTPPDEMRRRCVLYRAYAFWFRGQIQFEEAKAHEARLRASRSDTNPARFDSVEVKKQGDCIVQAAHLFQLASASTFCSHELLADRVPSTFKLDGMDWKNLSEQKTTTFSVPRATQGRNSTRHRIAATWSQTCAVDWLVMKGCGLRVLGTLPRAVAFLRVAARQGAVIDDMAQTEGLLSARNECSKVPKELEHAADKSYTQPLEITPIVDLSSLSPLNLQRLRRTLLSPHWSQPVGRDEE